MLQFTLIVLHHRLWNYQRDTSTTNTTTKDTQIPKMKLVPITLLFLVVVEQTACRRTKKARESLKLDEDKLRNKIEDVDPEFEPENPNRDKRGLKHYIHFVKPMKHFQKVKIVPAKIHYHQEHEEKEEEKVHHTFEETHEHVEHKEEHKEESEVHVPVEPHHEEVQYHHEAQEVHEEKVKVKHHHHHHHHNHVKTVIKKEPYPVEKIIHVPVEKIVHVPKPYPVEKIVEKIVNVPVEKIVHVPKPYPVEKIIEKPVHIEKKVEVKVPYPVEKIVHVHVPVEKIVEKIVQVPKPYPVEKIINKIIHVPKPYPVYKPVPYPIEVKIPVPVEKPVPYAVERKIPVPYKVEVEKQVTVEKRVPVYIHVPFKYGASEHHGGNEEHHEIKEEPHYHEIHSEHGGGGGGGHGHGHEHYDQPGYPSDTKPKYTAAAHSSNIRAQLMQQQIENFGYHQHQHQHQQQHQQHHQQEQQEAQSKDNVVSIGDSRHPNQQFQISVDDNEPQPAETSQIVSQMQPITVPVQFIQFAPMPFQSASPVGFAPGEQMTQTIYGV